MQLEVTSTSDRAKSAVTVARKKAECLTLLRLERKRELSDLKLLSKVDPIVEESDKIVTEITALAKVRHQDILS